MSETNETVHHAFHQAQDFVRGYLAHVERMLRDAMTRLETSSWRFLRYNGERFLGNLDTTTKSEAWMVDQLHGFYAPTKAFHSKAYGVDAAEVPRVAFVAVALQEAIPELWLGWVEGHKPEGNIESKLGDFYALIDPPELPGVPDPVNALEALTWSAPVANEESPEIRVALERVPFSLITSSADLRRAIDALLKAVGT